MSEFLKNEMTEPALETEPVIDVEKAYREMIQIQLDEINILLNKKDSEAEKLVCVNQIIVETLNEYLLECQKNGIELTADMAEKEIEKLNLSVEDLFGKKIDSPEIKKIYEEIVLNIKWTLKNAEKDNSTVLSRIRGAVESKMAKLVMVTAMLALKFGVGGAKAADSDKDPQVKKNTIEATFKKPVGLDGGDDKKYDASKDFKSNKVEDPSGTIKHAIKSYFDTDKDKINNSEQIKSDFSKFFGAISSDNFDKTMDYIWTFKSSSDPRKTPNWGGSNENLAEARYASFLKIFNEARASFDFTNSDLSEEQIKKIMAKEVFNSHPDGGETKITDLINPATKKPYTITEAAALKGEALSKALEECRFADFKVETNMFRGSDNYSQCIVIADITGSTEKYRQNMADNLKDININKPVTVAFFDNKLVSFKQVDNSEKAAAELMKTPISEFINERALSSAYQYLEKIPPEDISSKVMYVATDEDLQDVNAIFALIKKGVETNTTVNFLMFHDQAKKYESINTNELLEIIKAKIDNADMVERNTLLNNYCYQESQLPILVDKVIDKLRESYRSGGSLGSLMEKDGVAGIKDNDYGAMKTYLESVPFNKIREMKNNYYGQKLYECKLDLLYLKQQLEKNNPPYEKKLLGAISPGDKIEDGDIISSRILIEEIEKYKKEHPKFRE